MGNDLKDTFHITDELRPMEDRWKWEYAIVYIGMAFNSLQFNRNYSSIFNGDAIEYYRQFAFYMNTNTSNDIEHLSDIGVAFVTTDDYMTVGIGGISVRIDNNLPDGRVVLVKGAKCVSFDWNGKIYSKIAECEQ